MRAHVADVDAHVGGTVGLIGCDVDAARIAAITHRASPLEGGSLAVASNHAAVNVGAVSIARQGPAGGNKVACERERRASCTSL